MIRRYRALMGQGGEATPPPSRLPDEYQEVEYITIQQDDANGWANRIVTNIAWEQVTKIEATMNNVPLNSQIIFFAGELFTSPYIGRNGRWYLAGINTTFIEPATIDEFLSMVGKRTLTVEFTTVTGTIMSFGGFNSNYWSRTIDWYEVKLYHVNEIIAHFIPCYRKSDNKVGMYDIVREQFFTNYSKGTFLAGAEV